MKTRKWNQVHCDLVQVHIQRPLEAGGAVGDQEGKEVQNEWEGQSKGEGCPRLGGVESTINYQAHPV